MDVFFCPADHIFVFQQICQRNKTVQPVGHGLPALLVAADPFAVGNVGPNLVKIAEKQIAETTQALEALQAQFATDVEGIYKSESKDVEAQINNRIINRLAKLNLPKNDLEYIGKAIYNNSLVGTLYEIGLNAAAGGSGTDYIVKQCLILFDIISNVMEIKCL